MANTTAKVIADSTYNGVRITTFQLRYPRFIHSQIMTHRVFSRSARSSRAVPIKKIIQEVEQDPVTPVITKGKKGMSPTDIVLPEADMWWGFAVQDALQYATIFAGMKASKEITNRILEPYSYIDVVLTSTDWANFYALRIDHHAQKEIQQLAQVMLDAHQASEPVERHWHCPYVDRWDPELSMARCARVSYKPFDSETADETKDRILAKRLKEDGHWSPAEHQATAMWRIRRFFSPRSGNLYGWNQYRKQFKTEVQKFPGFDR